MLQHVTHAGFVCVCVCMCVFVYLLNCVCVCVFIKLHITAQSGLVILVILCHSRVCVCVCVFMASVDVPHFVLISGMQVISSINMISLLRDINAIFCMAFCLQVVFGGASDYRLELTTSDANAFLLPGAKNNLSSALRMHLDLSPEVARYGQVTRHPTPDSHRTPLPLTLRLFIFIYYFAIVYSFGDVMKRTVVNTGTRGMS